jgi:peptidyl-prolyl cis-trans isomerase B (cyclophilin B)
MHAENFIKLSQEGYYDGQLFHRVISGFMIQTGDPNSKIAKKGQLLGGGGPGYTIPGEFHPSLYHKKGALATARQGDQVNPNKESSGSQFYIVQGEVLSDAQLNAMEANGSHIKFTPEQRNIYKTIGGTPHLDYTYTVFGEVVEGLEVIDKIASVPTDRMNRPFDDVKIIKVTVAK